MRSPQRLQRHLEVLNLTITSSDEHCSRHSQEFAGQCLRKIPDASMGSDKHLSDTGSS